MSDTLFTTILGDLIAIHSTADDPEALQAAVDYCAERLRGVGLDPHILSSGGLPSLIATTRDTKRPALLLQAHLDVVPGPAKLFQLTRDGDMFRGRGVFDMKFAAAAFLAAFESLQEILPRLDVGIMLTTDEEQTSEHGAGYMASLGYGGDTVILPDGGDNWRVEAFAKGAWSFWATAHGISAHASRPWEGQNAVDTALQFVKEVKELFPHPSHDSTTVVVTQLEAGDAINQIPDRAKVGLDIRFGAQDDQGSIIQKIQSIASNHHITIRERTLIPPHELNTAAPAVTEWQRVVSDVRGVDSYGFSMSFGASDARFFQGNDTTVILTRPTGGGAHALDEWISAKESLQFCQVIEEYVKHMA